MAKGELTILRCREIARRLRDELNGPGDIKHGDGVLVELNVQQNVILIVLPDQTRITLRPISISPIQ